MGVASEPTAEERRYYALNRNVYGGAFSRFYDALVSPIQRLRHAAARMGGIDAHSRVLDVATGTGAQARAFARIAGEVVGIDLSEAMLRVARRKSRSPNLTFRQGDASQLPFPDGRFDVSCISFALHEMPPSIRERVAPEIARVTRPCGTILVIDYGMPPHALGRVLCRLVRLYERDHYAEFIRSDLRGLLRRSGIEVRDERPLLQGLIRIVRGSRSRS